MSGITARLIVAVLFTAAADYLLYGRVYGCGVTVFALLIASAMAVLRKGLLLRARGWLLVWGLVALAATVDSSAFGTLLLVLLGWAILAMSLMPEERPTVLSGMLRGLAGGGRSMAAGPSDLRRSMLLRRGRRTGSYAPAWVYGLPLLLVVVFAALIVPANLVLARWTVEAFDRTAELLIDLSFSRIFFWLMVGLGVYGLYRFRLGRRRAQPWWDTEAQARPDDEQQNALKACVLTFAGLNGLYLLANGADLFFLWASFDLPAGMTYAEYAHQGSYRLIVAVVLAALTVTAFLPTGSLQLASPKARILTYLFIVQNLVVLAGAGRRLHLYVAEYGLTRFRVAVVLWLILVAVGFVLIWIRVRGGRRILFLFRTNAVSTVLLLAAVALLDIDGYIAHWNVSRYRDGAHREIDVAYLAELGPAAIPELARLARVAHEKGDAGRANRARAMLRRRVHQERSTLDQSWVSWTWRRWASVRAGEAALSDSFP